MGEIADAMLEGFLDEETGEVVDGTAPGYPRRASDAVRQSEVGNQAAHASRLPFPCPGCGRSFKHKGDLRLHRAAKSH